VRASRLLQLLLLLQARGAMSAPQLAAELEVSVRTIYRDLEALSSAGVPVYTETGRGGGARLVDGWRTHLTGLTSAEADSLPLLGMPAAAAELGLGSVLAATQLKVLAALPPELRSRAARVAERFHLDAPGWFHRDDAVPHLGEVSAAVWDDHRLRIRYERGDAVVERTIDPLGLVLKAGTWYLVATHEGDPRTYRVSRIVGVERLDERFDRPDGFDLAARWAASSASFERGMRDLPVRLRMDPADVPMLRHALDPGTYETVDVQGDEVALVAESVDVILRHLLWLGAHVEVLSPPELRERIAGELRAAAARYADVGVDDSADDAATSRAAVAR
jgi:predicted DNA-binding transcriptional regulator YafY